MRKSVCCLCLVFAFAIAGVHENIQVEDLRECEGENVETPAGFSLQMEIAGEDANKVLNGELELPFDVDETIEYKVGGKQLVDGKWKDLPMEIGGNFCSHVHKFIPQLWDNLCKLAGVNPVCPIKAGSYSVSGLTATPNDVQLFSFLNGTYLLKIKGIRNDAIFICKQIQVTFIVAEHTQ